jgi:hypothetical protein
VKWGNTSGVLGCVLRSSLCEEEEDDSEWLRPLGEVGGEAWVGAVLVVDVDRVRENTEGAEDTTDEAASEARRSCGERCATGCICTGTASSESTSIGRPNESPGRSSPDDEL